MYHVPSRELSGAPAAAAGAPNVAVQIRGVKGSTVGIARRGVPVREAEGDSSESGTRMLRVMGARRAKTRTSYFIGRYVIFWSAGAGGVRGRGLRRIQLRLKSVK